MTSCADILYAYFPIALRERLEKLQDGMEEIRLRIYRPIQVIYPDRQILTDIITDEADFSYLLESFTEHSAYTFEDEMRAGYITLPSCGARVGISGNVFAEGGRVVRFRTVTGFCLRFPHEVKGCATELCRETGGLDASVIIASPPGAGKTTLLRDMARELSDTHMRKVCIVDERSEIAGVSFGKGGFDTGLRTDVLDACPKAEGISIAVRTLSPDVLITDEIGGRCDTEQVLRAVRSGISCAVSIHADNEDDLAEICPEILNAVRYTAFLRKATSSRFLLLHDRRTDMRKTMKI